MMFKTIFKIIFISSLFSFVGLSSSLAASCSKKDLAKFREKWPTLQEEQNFYSCFQDKKIYSISIPGYLKLALKAKDSEVQNQMVESALEYVPKKYEIFIYKKLKGKKLLLSPKVSSDLMYYLALVSFDQKKIKSALKYLSKQVGTDFKRYGQSVFLKAVIMTKLGKLNEAESLFSRLVNSEFMAPDNDIKKLIKSTSMLNLARIRIELEDYKAAVINYQNVSFRDNMWFDGLVEMSWAMLSRSDYEGAIGNAGFVDKTTSSFIYKPWLPVIESVGLLKICQYPNAKKSVEQFNSLYKNSREATLAHIKKNGSSSWYKYASGILDTKVSKSSVKKTPSLLFYAAKSSSVVAKQRAINELIEEEDGLLSIKKKLKNKTHTYAYKLALSRLNTLNKNINSLQKEMGKAFKTTVWNLLKEHAKLQKIIDVVDFEAFARSSDSITMRVAGKKFIDEMKKAGNKSASWNYNGEFWADEAGRFRSLLKNKCEKN